MYIMVEDISVDDICIIITGLVIPSYIDEIINTYKNIKNKIISTWFDQDSNLINILKDHGFIVLLNNYPQTRASFNYQFTQIKNGILKAKQMGFKYIIRFRTDTYIKQFKYDNDSINLIKNVYRLNNDNIPSIVLNNYDDKLLQFIDCTKHLYNKITFVSGELCHKINIHPTDLIYFGDVNELLIMFDDTESNFGNISEKLYLEKYFKTPVTTITQYKSKINSCIIECVNNEIDIAWSRSIHNGKTKYLISEHLINNQIRNHKFIIY